MKNSVKSRVTDVANQYGSGAFTNTDDAIKDLERRISEQ